MNDLERMRQHVLGRFATLFATQVTGHHFAASVGALTQDTHADIVSGMERAIALPAGFGKRKFRPIKAKMRQDTARLTRLDSTLRLLLAQQGRQRQNTDRDLKQLLVEFHRMTESLAETLVDKKLLERQSQVLTTIIQSHENVSQWREFVHDVLAGLHSVFPFDVFFIAFAEEGGCKVYRCFVGGCSDAVPAGHEHIKEAIAGLGLASDVTLEIEEFQLKEIGHGEPSGDIRMIAARVPEQAASTLAGIHGVVHCSARPMTAHEQGAIRSLLEVIAMVVGSSKAMSRTISELEYYSSHDPLTGLHNRRYFNEMLDYEIGRSARHLHQFSILMLDLDDFKDVNDTYGHPAGDAVLQRVAETIRSVVRKGDIATRIGGDEFAIIFSETGPQGARVVAEKLRTKLRNLIFEGAPGKSFHITASIGLATYPADAQTISDLMAGVDMSLYRAKELGKDQVGALDAPEKLVRANRLTFDSAERLRTALTEGRIVAHYQPITSCRTGEFFACEALARLVELDGQIVAAGQFINTIEKYGLSSELDRAIVAQALAAIRSRIDQGHVCPRVFINLSARDIQGRGIISFAERLCIEFAIPPDAVVFEILERDAIGDMTHMRTFLNDLRRKGFLFALDDFGSGYNSFHYLRELSFDFVKIDGAFVKNILTSRTDRALVRNLSRLCQDLGIRTVAEWVESAEVHAALREMDIDYVQGSYFGLPGKLFVAPHRSR